MKCVKDFAANVYEAFSQLPPDPTHDPWTPLPTTGPNNASKASLGLVSLEILYSSIKFSFVKVTQRFSSFGCQGFYVVFFLVIFSGSFSASYPGVLFVIVMSIQCKPGSLRTNWYVVLGEARIPKRTIDLPGSLLPPGVPNIFQFIGDKL